MITVQQVLKDKGYSDVWIVSPGASVNEALKLMSDKNVGALPVTEAGKLVGIISERDYARKVILKGKSSLSTPVSEIMTADVISVQPEQSMEECMTLMTQKRVRHLPVLVEDKLVGLISIGDVLKEIISDQKAFIESLQNYIEGTGYGQ
ncbi:MAG: CBS domain-containing protein [Anaerolineae bacterium]|nr:CBS domain-containing protein [Anaerolineae bacterium]